LQNQALKAAGIGNKSKGICKMSNKTMNTIKRLIVALGIIIVIFDSAADSIIRLLFCSK